MSSDDRPNGLSKSRCKELIHDMLVSNGQREILMRLIQSRLAQCGWTSALRTRCIDHIKGLGVENVNVSHMVTEMVPKGVETFPDSVKDEIEDALWQFATEFMSVDDEAPSPVDSDSPPSFSDSFTYQSRDVKPDPGIGYNVPSPEIRLSRTPSPVSIPRPLTPQPPIPILKPENIKDELLSPEEDEEEEEEEEEEGFSPNHVDGNQENEMEEEEPEEEMEEPTLNNHIESEEEELLDI